LMARNRTQNNRQYGCPQCSCTHEPLCEEVEHCEGVPGAPQPAPQAADAGGGSARGREGMGGGASGRAGSAQFLAQGDYLDPRFLMFQAFSNSLMGSVCLRGEIERRVRG
jgi:hypothetical protein